MEANDPKPKKTYSVWHLAAVLVVGAIVFKIGVALGTFGTVLGLVGILAGAVFMVKRPGRRILGAAAIFAAFWLLMGAWFASTKRDAEEAKAAQDAAKEKQQLTLKASYADLITKGDEKTKAGAHADALVLFRQAMSLPDLPVAEREQARLRLRDAAVLSGNVEEVKKATLELASTLDRAQLLALIQKGEMPATTRGNPQVEAGLREPLVAAATERLTKLTEEEKLKAAADAAKEKADAEAAKEAKAEEKKRLAARKFLKIGPDQLIMEIATDPDRQEKLETQWVGSYVRWKSKYIVDAVGMGYFFKAGSNVEMECVSLAPGMDEAVLKGMAKWQAVTVEGRLKRVAALGAKTDPSRVGLVFDDCLIK